MWCTDKTLVDKITRKDKMLAIFGDGENKVQTLSKNLTYCTDDQVN